MATAIVKNKLSGSTDGRGVAVAATSSPGTTIHTAQSGTTAGSFDEVWLYAVNIDTVTRTLTIQCGGTSTSDNIVITLAANTGLVLVLPGLVLQNSDVIKAFADAANKVNVFGFVNTITA